jgi:hypothetical protein
VLINKSFRTGVLQHPNRNGESGNCLQGSEALGNGRRARTAHYKGKTEGFRAGALRRVDIWDIRP